MQLDSLAQRIQELSSKKQAVDGEFQAWLDDVAALYQSAAQWLSDEVERKQLKLFDQNVQVRELDGSSYYMVQKAIEFEAGPFLLLVPQGRTSHGVLLKHNDSISVAKGRVDLIHYGTRKSVSLYRTGTGAWLMATPDGATPWTLVDQAQFRSAMAALLV